MSGWLNSQLWRRFNGTTGNKSLCKGRNEPEGEINKENCGNYPHPRTTAKSPLSVTFSHCRSECPRDVPRGMNMPISAVRRFHRGVPGNKLASVPGLTLSILLEKASLWRSENTGPGHTKVTAIPGWFSTRNASNQPCSGKQYRVITHGRIFPITDFFMQRRGHFDGLVQERRNSIDNALELRLSCTNPSI